ncbi:MAG: hypothetical protein JXR95_11050 [Deltaproteobacteria bacterium]|nr:hypothetical protein [Deltaproteobacteria bacterium]
MKVFNTLVLSLIFSLSFQSCHSVDCGEGTVEENGTCVPLNIPDVIEGETLCASGSHWNSALGQCFVDPETVCGTGTQVVWNEDSSEFTCVSTGNPELPECPEATPGGPICITGKVRYFIDPGDETKLMTSEITDPLILDQIEIVVYDPLDYAAKGSDSEPLGRATIDATLGAFIATEIIVPTQGYIALVVRDKNWTPDSDPESWPFTGYAYQATPGINIEGTYAVTITNDQLNTWQSDLETDPSFIGEACSEGHIYNCGTWIGIYQDEESKTPIDGVVPYYGTNTRVPATSMAFIDKNTDGKLNILTRGTDRAHTSDTGIVMYFGAELTSYFGLCDFLVTDNLCNDWEMNFPKTLQGGSSQKTLFVEFVDGTRLN